MDMSMRARAFADEKMKAVRERLGSEKEVDDFGAMRMIIQTIFDDEKSNFYSYDDIESVIRRIFYKTRRKLGILQPLLDDADVSEIMVNGPADIFVERNGKIEKYKYGFDSIEELEEVMRNIAGEVHREINERSPIVDARLPDGSRVNGVYKNIALNVPILTIRKFSEDYMRMGDLVRNSTISEEGAELLKHLVRCGYNIFVSGGTSSGKTTLLNALAEAVPRDERVIIIEDSAELKMGYIENIVHLECRNSNAKGEGRVSMSDLIKSSLRMRPNRIIVGEVRGSEVVDMLQAMNTGHDGSLSTGHANSVEGMLKRLESLYLAAMPISVDAIREQIAEGINIMVHIARQKDGRRRVTEITELLGYSGDEFTLNPLMKTNIKGKLARTGYGIEKPRKEDDKYSDKLYGITAPW